jgi:hypothetical protein
MIGWFLLLAAEAEADAATTHIALAGLRVRDAMVASVVIVGAVLSLERFMDEVFLCHRHTARRPAWEPRAVWPGVRVGERMTPLQHVAAVHADDELEEAWATLLTSPSSARSCSTTAGSPGLLCATDVLRILEASGTAGEQRWPWHPPTSLRAARARTGNAPGLPM